MTISPLDSHVFGNLFGSQDMNSVFADDMRFVRMLDVEAALARVQARLGVIPEEAADVISTKAKAQILDFDRLRAGTEKAGFPVIPVVAALSEACGEEAGRYVHWGATTQDIVDTALMLQMRDAFDLIERDLADIASELAVRANTYRDAVMAGRTHLQHAVPVTFGFKVAVWLSSLLDLRDMMPGLRGRCLRVQYSGAAGTLSALSENGIAVCDALADELSLGRSDISWHTRRAPVAEAASFLSLVCGALAKIAKDVILMSQTEVGEMAETSQKGRGGSSTMPQKRNPVMSEYVLACTRNVHAMLPVMMGAMVHDQERATDSWQAEWAALPAMFALTGGALSRMRAVATEMHVDTDRMRRNLDMTGGLIMAEAVQTALREKLGHEKAHDAVTTACRVAMGENIPLRDALLRDAEIMSVVSETEIDSALAPENYTGCSGELIDRVLARL